MQWFRFQKRFKHFFVLRVFFTCRSKTFLLPEFVAGYTLQTTNICTLKRIVYTVRTIYDTVFHFETWVKDKKLPIRIWTIQRAVPRKHRRVVNVKQSRSGREWIGRITRRSLGSARRERVCVLCSPRRRRASDFISGRVVVVATRNERPRVRSLPARRQRYGSDAIKRLVIYSAAFNNMTFSTAAATRPACTPTERRGFRRSRTHPGRRTTARAQTLKNRLLADRVPKTKKNLSERTESSGRKYSDRRRRAPIEFRGTENVKLLHGRDQKRVTRGVKSVKALKNYFITYKYPSAFACCFCGTEQV